jgi:heme exporter protein A
MLLSAENLTCVRNNREILSDISIKLNSNQIISLYGPNGSGKTTLLKTLANILPYTKGAVLNPEREICFLGHSNCLKADLTVFENLLFWNGIYQGNQIEIAVSLLELKEIVDIPIIQLSAGQKRKVGLARLLISKSKLWLLDEPYASLDQHNFELFNKIMKTHLLENGGIIIATHSPIEFENVEVLNMSNFKVLNNYENDPFAGSF